MTAPTTPDAANSSAQMPRIRVAAVIVKDEALLLVRHVKGERTYWLLPGGGVEHGESAGDALVREMKEETNLDVVVRDLVMANDSIPPDAHRHVVNLYFTADVVGGDLAMGDEANLAELRYVPFEALADLDFYPDIREALLPALRAGLPGRAAYLGNLWK